MTRADMMINTIHVGDCRHTMRRLIADGIKVQCIVTSPPYWGLRDYGVSGQFGLERTWMRHVARMRSVFRLCWDLLADDGVLWLNYGDSYYTNRPSGRDPGKTSTINGKGTQDAYKDAQRARHSPKQFTSRGAAISGPNRRQQRGIKPKDLVGMPWRIAFALQDDGWYLRSDVIWHKKNPMPESVSDRPTKSHEYVFLLAKSERYYFDADAVKEPASEDTNARYARGRGANPKNADGGPGNQTIAKTFDHMKKPVAGWASGDGSHNAIDHARQGSASRKFGNNGVGFGHGYDAQPKPRVKNNASFDEAMETMPDRRNIRTVWSLATEAFSGAHFATFPRDLVRRCILSGSRPGDVVLDPFMGSGTVAQVADELGRQWLGCELNPQYAAMYGSQRVAQLGMGI